MNEPFFITAIPANALTGSYNFFLVAVSFVIATLASYVALDMAGQFRRETNTRIRYFWHIGGAFVLGAGIWSMHFTGMLAYDMGMSHAYDFGLTALSLLLPIAFAFIVFRIIGSPSLSTGKILLAAPALGLSIALMHYLGMAAMQMGPELRYTPGWFAVSLAVAIAASAGALWLTAQASTRSRTDVTWFKLLGAFVMGLAICGLHYTGMQAAVFIPSDDMPMHHAMAMEAGLGESRNAAMAASIGFMMLLILMVAIIALNISQRFAGRLRAEVARQTEALQQNNMQLQLQQEALQQRSEQLASINAEIQGARDMAEAASIAKSEFLATMSHEIRTPINAIVGIANLLQKGQIAPEKQQAYFDTLHTSASNLLSLIEELLDISKIESNQIELEQIDFDLKDLLEGIVAIMDVRAQEKQLLLMLSYGSSNPLRLRGDPHRIRQIMVNLVGNAVKFTEVGAITITVRIRARHSDPTQVEAVISVTDTGIGVPPERKEAIFDKFTQADSSVSRKYGGTGLGLSISRGLAERMGGTLTMENQPVRGSEFTLRIPLELAAS